MLRFSLRSALCGMVLALVMSTPAIAADSEKSVVQIRCSTENGTMKATGFVWPEPGHVVTALHAVAGCATASSVVYSEFAGTSAKIDSILAADLEGDLALLRLSKDMGLPPVNVADTVADLRNEHVVWGYPLAAEQIIGLRIEFALGLADGTTTLGRAFSSKDLGKLFRDQGYPTRNTEILRVTTTIQPGHSGAPILDPEGKVVAIANGGLLGGWRGINWSIPAHVYLPDLPDSPDPIPGGISEQAELFSAYAVEDSKSIALGAGAALELAEPAGETDLIFGGLVPLPAVLDALDAPTDENLTWILEDLDYILPNRASWEAFRYDAVQVAQSERTLFVPQRATATFDPARGLVDATSIDGAVRQITMSYMADSFDAALKTASRVFLERLAALGVPGVPLGFPDAAIDADLEFVDFYEMFGDPEAPPFIDVVVQVNGPEILARAVHVSRSFDDMSDADYVDYMMMDVATYHLNDFFPLDDEILAGLSFASVADGFAPDPSVLDLVRRVPLADVARDFVADRDFGWKSDLAYLKSLLDDPAAFDALAFDVYEDRVTGATIAVPSGLDLVWNEEMGAVTASHSAQGPELAIAIQRAPGFRDASGAGALGFLEDLTGYAAWEGRAPTECDMTLWVADREAECWDYFVGADKVTGEFADLHVALNVMDDVFLGTSVYIVGEEEDLSQEEAITYLMMLISAEYLSDFAAK